MFRFFASLRKMIALDTSRTAIGEAAVDHIERLYIPELERLIEEEENPAEREDLERALRLWRDSVSGSERAKWNQEAARAVQGVVQFKWRQPESVAEDVAQEIAKAFYDTPRMYKIFDRFANLGKGDEAVKEGLLQGPVALMRLWKSAITMDAMWRIRLLVKHHQEFPGTRVTEVKSPEGEARDVFETLEAPEAVELDAPLLKKMFRDLSRYVIREAGDEVNRDLFKTWVRKALAKGADGVRFGRDVLPDIMERHGLGKSIVYRRWGQVVSTIISFFEKVRDMRLTERAKRSLRASGGSEAVVSSEFRRRAFARWMLGGRDVWREDVAGL